MSNSLTSFYNTGFRCNFIQYFVFIIPMLGITFNVFYRVDFAGESSSVAHSSFMYLYPVPEDGRMNDCNML